MSDVIIIENCLVFHLALQQDFESRHNADIFYYDRLI